MTVYADILFLINVSMDYSTLYLTGKFLHKRMEKKRLLAASVFGGLGGTVCLLCPVHKAVLTVCAGFLLAAGMTRIVFGKEPWKSLVRDSLCVWGTGTLLGGMMTCLLSLGAPPVYGTADERFLPAVLLCMLLSQGCLRLFSVRRAHTSASVEVEAGGIRKRFYTLCDTGNFAAEPISGLPVILLRAAACPEWAEQLTREPCPLRLRLVPVGSVNGESLLRGFLPEEVCVNGERTEAVIAVTAQPTGEYEGILPAVLCGKRAHTGT